MNRLDPYLRYIAISNYLPNKDFVKAYDCRLFFVLSGKGELRTDTETFPLTENTLAYYPSGIPYLLSSSKDEPMEFVSVNFDFTKSYPERRTTLRPVRVADFSPELQRTTQNEVTQERFKSAFTVEHAFFLRDDLTSLSNLFGKGEVYTDEMCSTLLKYILLKIENHFSTANGENKLVRKIKEYIEKNYAERLDNGTVAAHFGYHAYYLSSLFKLNTGKPLHRFITETRLKFGCNMLLNTDMSISEIALKCGFQNANHFSVKFKNQYKESPSKWRTLNGII